MSVEFIKTSGPNGAALTHPDYLAELDFEALSSLAKEVSGSPELGGVRTGRGGHGIFDLNSGRKVFVREYCRGGLVRHFNSRWFLNSGKVSRPFAELKILQMLGEHGVRVPRPLAAAVFFSPLKLFYSGIIVLEQLTDAKNLLVLGYDKDPRFEKFAGRAGIEARKALDLGICHSDLHPGNVLLNAAGDAILIDFDKTIVGGACRDRLVKRWEKSLRKHELSDLEGGAFRRAVLG